MKGDQVVARRCYNTLKKASNLATLMVGTVGELKGEPVKPLEKIIMGEGRL